MCLVFLAGCAGAEAMSLPASVARTPPHEQELGFVPGESMSYEVQLQGLLVGEAQLAVGEIGNIDGRRALVVKSRAATAGAAALVRQMVDESTTVIDLDTGRPMQVDTLVVNGDKRTTASARFETTTAHITYRRTDDPPQHMKIEFGTQALFDMHSAMAQLRGWRAAKGATKSVFIVGGRRLWRIDLKYAGEDTIGSKIGSKGGNRRAVIYEGTSYRARRDLKVESKTPARTFRVWMSDDADHVPLKCSAQTELGAIVMDLVEYNRP